MIQQLPAGISGQSKVEILPERIAAKNPKAGSILEEPRDIISVDAGKRSKESPGKESVRKSQEPPPDESASGVATTGPKVIEPGIGATTPPAQSAEISTNPTIMTILEATPPESGCVTESDFMSAFTDPRDHTPWTFCYAVHAMSPQMEAIIRAGMKQKGTYRADQDIDLMHHPEKISHKKRIYCSVITPQHQKTWARCMYVLRFPFRNVLSTSARDTGGYHMINGTPQDKGPTLTPRQMIEANRETHNELTLAGEGVEIAAVAVKVLDVRGKSYYPPETKQLREIARGLNVPFIELHQESHVEDGPPRFSINECGIRHLDVCRDGFKYRFFLFPETGQLSCGKTIGGTDGEDISPEEYARLRDELASVLKKADGGPDMLARLDAHFRTRG